MARLQGYHRVEVEVGADGPASAPLSGAVAAAPPAGVMNTFTAIPRMSMYHFSVCYQGSYRYGYLCIKESWKEELGKQIHPIYNTRNK
jgi:hypothetical protein